MFQMFSTLAALVLLASNAALAIPDGYSGGGYGGHRGPAWHKRGDDLQKAWKNASSERTYGHNGSSMWGSSRKYLFITWMLTIHPTSKGLKAHINIHLNSGRHN